MCYENKATILNSEQSDSSLLYDYITRYVISGLFKIFE